MASDFFDPIEIDVANESVIGAVDADIDHRGTGLDHIGGNEIWPANRDDQNVGLACDGGQVLRATVAERNRRVGATLGEHDRQRLANDVTTTNNYDMLAYGGDVVAF